MDINTRRLRYFVAVAEDLHFSRAASRLYVAQQALSKQIRELEAEVGMTLLDRTTRRVELTEDGERFLDVARLVLREWDEGLRTVQEASRASRSILRLGFMPGAALELTRLILAEFSRRYPEVDVRLQEYGLSDPSCGLNSGSSDVAIIRPPVTIPALRRLPLFAEPVVACVPSGHPLSGRETVAPLELVGEKITLGGGHDAAWRDFWTLAPFRSPGQHADIVETTSPTEESELVASGVAIAVAPAALGRYLSRPGVSYIPVEPHPGSEVAVGWKGEAPGPAVTHFVNIAREVRDREAELISSIEHPRVVNR